MAKEKTVIPQYVVKKRTLGGRVRDNVMEMIGRSDTLDTWASKVSPSYKLYRLNLPSIDATRTIYGLPRAIFYASTYVDKTDGKTYGEKYLLGAPLAKPIINIAAGFAMGVAPTIVESTANVLDKQDIASGVKPDDDKPDINDVPPANPKDLPANNLDPDNKNKPATNDPKLVKVPANPNVPRDDDGEPIADDVELDENGQPVTIEKAPEPLTIEQITVRNVNQWMDEQRGEFFRFARNSFRDGDVFVAMSDDGEMMEIAPEDVEIVQDLDSFGKIAGYDVFTTIKAWDDKGKEIKHLFVDEIRRTSRERFEITEKGRQRIRTPVAGTKIEFLDAVGNPKEERLPIIHFANEREGRQLYGMSDLQGLYYIFANYHAVLESGIEGVIYNNTPVPVLKNIKNMKEFLEQNFKKDEEGAYVVEWDNSKMLIGGEGFDAAMLSADGGADQTMTILEILFYLICQNSETPEFAFGTAVSSSKASVSEQTPLLIKKAVRKQSQLEKPVRELIELYIEKMAKKFKDQYTADLEFTVDMPSILDEDLNINQTIVTTLLDNGIITAKTAAIMLNVGKYVKDLDEEIRKAAQEKKDRTPAELDIFNQMNAEDTEEEDDLTGAPAVAAKAAKLATDIQEMIERDGLEATIDHYDGKLSEEQIKTYFEVV